MKGFALWSAMLLGTMAPLVVQASGQALFQQRCQACHQADASGSETLKAPALAGLSAPYLALQLRHFRDGVRGAAPGDTEGQLMTGMAKGLSDGDITALADYLAAQPTVMAPRPPAPQGFAARGLYSSCSSCHGASAEGFDSLGAPRLAGQHSGYLKAQLVKFRQGLRGTHPDDAHGAQMRAMAIAIPSEATLDTLVQYIGQQGR